MRERLAYEMAKWPAPWTTQEMDFALAVLEAVQLPFGWSLRALYDGGNLMVQVQSPLEWRGRKWLLSRHMTAGEIAQTVLKATITVAELEIRELLLYDGQPVFDPHYDVEKLVELRGRPDALKERSGP